MANNPHKFSRRGLCAAAGGLLRRPFHHPRRAVAVPADLARGQGLGRRHDWHRARPADGRAVSRFRWRLRRPIGVMPPARALIIGASALSVAGFAILGFADRWQSRSFSIASIVSTPIMLLAQVCKLRGLAQWGRAYGPVRLWGSAAFIVATFGAGFLLDVIEPLQLIWLVVAANRAYGGEVLAGPLEPPCDGPRRIDPSVRWLLRDRTFLAFTAAASLIQASHAVYGFSTIDWLAAGCRRRHDRERWASAWWPKCVVAVSTRMPAAMTPTVMISIGAAGAVIRWTAMALEPPAVVLPAVQCLHALSFGATHLGTLAFVARVAPPGLGTIVQRLYRGRARTDDGRRHGSFRALYGRYGGLAYGAMAVAGFAGGACRWPLSLDGWSGGKQRAPTIVVNQRIHRSQLAPAQIHHPLIEAAAPRDPPANRLRIDVHQELRSTAARLRPAGRHHPLPSGMKSRAGRGVTQIRSRGITPRTIVQAERQGRQ